MSLTIFEIPEVIDQIAASLLTKHLRECLLVSKTWYSDFLPHLWRDVAVLDFDMVHVENEFQSDNQCPDHNLGDGDCRGHAMTHKYSHFIRSMATLSTRSLMDLGPGCVNLERLCLGWTESERFISTPDSTTGLMIWVENEQEYEHQFDQTVLGLLRRNPKLRVVKGVPMTGRPFLEALGNLKHLEELWFKGSFISEILEKCGAKLKVLCALGENNDRFDGFLGESWNDGVDLESGCRPASARRDRNRLSLAQGSILFQRRPDEVVF
ncbi:MAG: hypothetical protein BYD32DRAFT_64697 [Podila humilis]|nr:MAG: hypothetical protein BYD32DRAFT_64697 [Podila humilis]